MALFAVLSSVASEDGDPYIEVSAIRRTKQGAIDCAKALAEKSAEVSDLELVELNELGLFSIYLQEEGSYTRQTVWVQEVGDVAGC